MSLTPRETDRQTYRQSLNDLSLKFSLHCGGLGSILDLSMWDLGGQSGAESGWFLRSSVFFCPCHYNKSLILIFVLKPLL